MSTGAFLEVLTCARALPLFDVQALRALEVAAQHQRPAHTLMQTAGLAVARLALAVAPHARKVTVLAGPGNNGGDGFEAALQLHAAGRQVTVMATGALDRLPPDATAALQRARAAGVAITPWSSQVDQDADLLIDALLGIGAKRPPEGEVAEAIRQLQDRATPVLSVDVPSGLDARTGALLGDAAVRARWTLSLLALKPGAFTAQGRDHCGEVWHHDLGIAPDVSAACAWLSGRPMPVARLHAQHKGSFGDVVVMGGAPGMAGAARLAARAALATGAGRVYLGLLDSSAEDQGDFARPEVMSRRTAWDDRALLSEATVVCGCGGGAAVEAVLQAVLQAAPRLVLDADALNAVARDPALRHSLQGRESAGHSTVLTPHPLEAARLLGVSTAELQADRLSHAQALADRFHCTVVLKGSGTVIASRDSRPRINPTGNALLGTAGTGDVLAGWIGGLWAQSADGDPQTVAASGVYAHGQAADRALAAGHRGPLRAADLVEALHALL